jgi:methylenetetrahydrofolate dehydrogenase (NADP+)/methenyltetrahydrofolate cyclohydrolase
MAKILDGKIVRDEIQTRLKKTIIGLKIKPVLAIIQIGNDNRSTAYIEQKKKFALAIGAEIRHGIFPEHATQKEVISKIEELNNDKNIHGILAQMPFPDHFNKNVVIDSIDHGKDVDGLTAVNIKKLWQSKSSFSEGFVPATAQAVLTLLDYYKIKVSGKKVVIVGRSELVGKPLAIALINRNATVTVCHSKTLNLREETKKAHILIVAIGSPHFINQYFVSQGQAVIDVGINLVNGALYGDVHFEKIRSIVSSVSPVPGGVGPLTVASLFENLVKAVKN